MKTKGVKLTEDEYVMLLRREIYDSQGYDADVLADNRAKALDYYFGKMEDSSDGRSDTVSHDVADVVHSLMAQIMPMFTSSMLQFTPESAEDESQAQLESDYVKQAIDKNNGFGVLYAAAFDALLQGNGWIKVEIDDTQEIERETYPKLDDMQLFQVSQARNQNEQVDVKPDKDGGYKIKRTIHKQKLKVRCVSPDTMLFSGSWDQFDLADLRFVAERILYTSSDLIKLGVPREVANALPDAAEDYWPAIRAREGKYQDDIAHEITDSQDAEILKECFDCYIRVDLDNSGETELRHVLLSGNDILFEEYAYCIPYATGSPVCVPHRIQGQGMYDLMSGIQDSKTSVLRKFEDTLETNINGRYEAVEGQVNMSDALNARVNGVVRVRAPGSFNPINTPQSTAEAIAGLNYLDTVREQRGGASLDMNDSDRQLMASSAAAATGMQSAHEKMAGWYCSNMVNTMLKTMFALVHKTLRAQMKGEQGAKLRGKWVTTEPMKWPERLSIEVTAGMTTAERSNKLSALTTVLQQQLGWIGQGYEGIITDRDKVFNAASDWMRAADLSNPSEYLIDPSSDEAIETANKIGQQEQQQRQQMEQMQQGMIQMQAQLEQQKLELDKYKHDGELKYKYYDTDLDAKVKAAQDENKSEIAEAQLTSETVIQFQKQAKENNEQSENLQQ